MPLPLPLQHPQKMTYGLIIRQQPVAARACGLGVRDRRTIDPPPVVQLMIENPDLATEQVYKNACDGHFIMTCSIYDGKREKDLSVMPEFDSQRRQMVGDNACIGFFGKDTNGDDGFFFWFSDLSFRWPGKFCLEFSVMKIEQGSGMEKPKCRVIDKIMSSAFTVYRIKSCRLNLMLNRARVPFCSWEGKGSDK